MFPDGYPQEFEEYDLDEYLCKSCGAWVPLSECPNTVEHYYGTYYNPRCGPCHRAKNRNYRHFKWDRNFKKGVTSLQWKDPDRALLFLKQFQRHYGGYDKVAERLIELIERSSDLGDMHAAMKGFELFHCIVGIASVENYAERQLADQFGLSGRTKGRKGAQLPSRPDHALSRLQI